MCHICHHNLDDVRHQTNGVKWALHGRPSKFFYILLHFMLLYIVSYFFILIFMIDNSSNNNYGQIINKHNYFSSNACHQTNFYSIYFLMFWHGLIESYWKLTMFTITDSDSTKQYALCRLFISNQPDEWQKSQILCFIMREHFSVISVATHFFILNSKAFYLPG